MPARTKSNAEDDGESECGALHGGPLRLSVSDLKERRRVMPNASQCLRDSYHNRAFRSPPDSGGPAGATALGGYAEPVIGRAKRRPDDFARPMAAAALAAIAPDRIWYLSEAVCSRRRCARCNVIYKCRIITI